jgi:hypothetical protein
MPAIREYLLPSTTASLRLPAPIVSEAVQLEASIRGARRVGAATAPAGPA